MSDDDVINSTATFDTTTLAPMPPTKTYTLNGRDNYELTFSGRFIGGATSANEKHQHEGEFAPPGWKCSACRWFEVKIYHVLDSNDYKYVVHTRGPSIIPNEVTKERIALAKTPYEVLKLLTQVRPVRGKSEDSMRPMLPQTSFNALDIAADFDDDLAEALERWTDAGA